MKSSSVTFINKSILREFVCVCVMILVPRENAERKVYLIMDDFEGNFRHDQGMKQSGSTLFMCNYVHVCVCVETFVWEIV